MNVNEKIVLGLAIGGGILLCTLLTSKTPAPADPNAPPTPPAVRQRLLYLTEAKCTWCVKFEKQTLANADVKARLAKDVDFKKLTGREAAAYKPAGYPCCVLLSPEGHEVRRFVGYKTPPEFLKWLDGIGGE